MSFFKALFGKTSRTIIINGKSYTGSNDITVNNKTVIIDGKVVSQISEDVINVVIKGDCLEATSDNGDIIIEGNATKVETKNGNIRVGESIFGDAETKNGNISAKAIGGKASTVNGNVHGKVK